MDTAIAGAMSDKFAKVSKRQSDNHTRIKHQLASRDEKVYSIWSSLSNFFSIFTHLQPSTIPCVSEKLCLYCLFSKELWVSNNSEVGFRSWLPVSEICVYVYLSVFNCIKTKSVPFKANGPQVHIYSVYLLHLRWLYLYMVHFFPYNSIKFCFDHPDRFWKQTDNSISTVYTHLIVQFVKPPPPFVAWLCTASGYVFTYSVI